MAVVTIRPAERADREAAVGLWLALQREHEALDPAYRLAADAVDRWHGDFSHWIRAKTDAVWVAEADGALVGLATAHTAWPAPIYEPRLAIYVDDLYVVPGWRRQGVGARLLASMRGWAREVGAVELRVGVLAANPDAVAFWSRHGGNAFAVTMTLPVEP